MKIIKLEQSGWIIETEKGFRIAIDIGKYTPLEKLKEVGPMDMMVISHIHADHFSPEHIKALSPKTLLLPKECYDVLQDLNVKSVSFSYHPSINTNFIITKDGFEYDSEDVQITFFAVDHGPNISSPIADNLGFLFTIDGGLKVYFAGDMFYPSGIDVTKLAVNELLLPVGGFYTFGPEEAFSFARSFRHIGSVRPMHYEKTPETREDFVRLVDGLWAIQ